jgi:hypothetical protein
MRPTVSILTTGVGPNQASGVGPVPLDKPNAVDADLLTRLAAARAAARARVWAAGLAPSKLTLDFDATLVDLHSDKEQAAPTYKRGSSDPSVGRSGGFGC